MDENSELIAIFFEEADDQLNALQDSFFTLERVLTDEDAIDSAFRAIHTLKGSSATVGLTDVSHLAHKLEDLLSAAREKTLTLQESDIDLFFQLIDTLTSLLGAHKENQEPESEVLNKQAEQVAKIQDRLEKASVIQTPLAADKKAASSSPPTEYELLQQQSEEEKALPLPDEAQAEIAHAESNDLRIVRVTVLFDGNGPMASLGPLQIYNGIKNVAPIIASSPSETEIVGSGDFLPRVDYYIGLSNVTEADLRALEPKISISDVTLSVTASFYQSNMGLDGGTASVDPKISSLIDDVIGSTPPASQEETLSVEQACAKAAADGLKIVSVKVEFNPDGDMRDLFPIQILNAAKELGQFIASEPSEKMIAEEDAFHSSVVYYLGFTPDTLPPLETIEKRLFLSDVTTSVKSNLVRSGQTTGSDGEQKAPVAAVKKAASPQGGGSSSHQSSAVRVDSDKINLLLNLIGEAVTNKATFTQILTTIETKLKELSTNQAEFRDNILSLSAVLRSTDLSHQTGAQVAALMMQEIKGHEKGFSTNFGDFSREMKSITNDFRSHLSFLSRNTNELHEAVLKMRMNPISSIMPRFHRLIRDLSRQLGKPATLVVEGEETEVDKSVLEMLVDPIMHCIRNCMDHGIELPEERRRAGKPAEGRVMVFAENLGNSVVLQIGDDGAGINRDAVLKKIIEKNLTAHPNELTDQEIFDFMFRPGFSTNAVVTDISGRGVGLDVVKSAIDKLGGTVSLETNRGKGTIFTIYLPLTLAIISALVVRLGKQVYAIAMPSIVETQVLQESSSAAVSGVPQIALRGKQYPLIHLSEVFGLPEDQGEGVQKYFVLFRRGQQDYALLVDELLEEQEIVIKPLNDPFLKVKGVSGATVMGSGSIALILDLEAIEELFLEKCRTVDERSKEVPYERA